MTRILLFLVILYAQVYSAQALPNKKNAVGPPAQVQSFQSIADDVEEKIRINPEKTSEIIRQAILSVHQPGQGISPESEAAIIAIISAGAAASTRENVANIVSAGVGVDAALAPIVAKSALLIFPKGIQSKLEGTEEEGGRVLGNVRVIKIIGRTAKTLDREGKTSAIKNGEFLRQGSHVFTGSEGDVTLLFDNGSTIQLAPETEFSIDQFIQDPFEAKVVDYQKLDGEPSKSSTRLTVEAGTIFTNVKKLKTGSTFQVTTPVGTMGIRGTGFFIRSLPGDGAPAVSFGVSNGQVQFTTASGATQSVQAGESFGVGGAEGGGNFTPNPPGATGLLESTANSASSAAQSMPSGAFNAAPPATPAPAQALSNLSPDQQQALEQAAVKGASAVVEAAAQLAVSDPSMAATIASAAAELSPGSALQIASGISAAVPGSRQHPSCPSRRHCGGCGNGCSLPSHSCRHGGGRYHPLRCTGHFSGSIPGSPCPSRSHRGIRVHSPALPSPCDRRRHSLGRSRSGGSHLGCSRGSRAQPSGRRFRCSQFRSTRRRGKHSRSYLRYSRHSKPRSTHNAEPDANCNAEPIAKPNARFAFRMSFLGHATFQVSKNRIDGNTVLREAFHSF